MRKMLFKSDLQMYISLFLMTIMLILFIVIGTYDFNKEVDSDATRFSQLFTNVAEDNVFKFINATEANNIISGTHASGIILFGFKTNIWTSYYAEYINDVAKEMKIDEVHYYDFEKDRRENNGTYETIVNKLAVYATSNDYSKMDLYAPTLVVVKDGDVIAFLDETALRKGSVTPDVYWQDYQVNNFKNNLRIIFKEYRG